ncbi:MAG: hypothetical protein E7626_08130, partial [Ruminococcaceae bacterium]|nr:hypothetical protein [Oscillospiraceae bacterium]
MKKRLISMLLVLSFVISMIPLSVFATAETEKAAAQTVSDFAVVSGNSGDKVSKDNRGNFVIERNGTTATIVAKKDGNGYDTLDEGWIKLDMPSSVAYQLRRRQGIVFGAENISDLSTGTYYFAYIDTRDDLSNPYVRLAKVTDGALTTLYGEANEYRLNNILSARDVFGMDSIELSVYFTKDGVIKLYVENKCIFQTTGQTISGNGYAISVGPTVKSDGKTAHTNTGHFQFKSFITEGFDDYRLVYGGWDMGANGITSTLNPTSDLDDRAFWIANDTVEGNETLFRFSIKDYLNAHSGTYKKENGEYVLDEGGNKIPDTSTNVGIVFGATVPEDASRYAGSTKTGEIAYYMVFFQYDAATPANSRFGIARVDNKGFGTTWQVLVTKTMADVAGKFANTDWVTAGKDINGAVYYNQSAGVITVTIDEGRNAFTYADTDNLAKRSNANGVQYGVRTNAVGASVDVEAYKVGTRTRDGFYAGLGTWGNVEDKGMTSLVKGNSTMYSNEKISGNEAWYHFSATDYGYTDTGFIMGATIRDKGAWEQKNGVECNTGYCLFLGTNGGVTIGRYGKEYFRESTQANSWWYSLPCTGSNRPADTTYYTKDKDSTEGEKYGEYDVYVHQVYDPEAKTNTFRVFIGGVYRGTFVDDVEDLVLPLDGTQYGWRSIGGATFEVKDCELIKYPEWLDTTVRTDNSLAVDGTPQAIYYDPETGFLRPTYVGAGSRVIMSNQKLDVPASGVTTITYCADLKYTEYSENHDSGLVFGANWKDANYSNRGTYYVLVMGDQTNKSHVGKSFRLLKCATSGGFSEVRYKNGTTPTDSDRLSGGTNFNYVPGEIVHLKVVVTYDIPNNKNTIKVYVTTETDGQENLLDTTFVDTTAADYKDGTKIGDVAIVGTGIGARTDAGWESFANLKAYVSDDVGNGTVDGDGYDHWIECSCGSHINTEAHDKTGATARVEADCTTTGTRSSVTCPECNITVYQKDDGTWAVVEDASDLIIPATGHVKLTHYDEDPATCTEAGKEAHDVCACGVVLQNGVEVDPEDLVIEIDPTNHAVDLVFHAASAATCVAPGGVAYYSCASCQNNYSDEDGKIKIDSTATELDPDNHANGLTFVEGKSASCTDAGYEAYYKCDDCGKLYSDANGKSEIEEPVAIPATGHLDTTTVGYKEPTYNEEGYTGDVYCNDCEQIVGEGVSIPVKTGAVASVNGYNYETFAEAVANADGKTVVLLSDVVLTEKITVNGTQTWNFAGYSLTSVAITDNYAIVVKGDLTIEGGEFLLSPLYGIGVLGKLTVDGGRFIANGDTDYLVGNWGTTVINEGDFEGFYCCVNNFQGTTEIYGGTYTIEGYEGEYYSATLLANSGLTVYGGSFSDDMTAFCVDAHTVLNESTGLYEYGAHSHVAGTVVEPTCMDGGYTIYTCACGDTYNGDLTEKNADNHVIDPETAPWVSDANNHWKACTCGAELNKGAHDGLDCTICG